MRKDIEFWCGFVGFLQQVSAAEHILGGVRSDTTSCGTSWPPRCNCTPPPPQDDQGMCKCCLLLQMQYQFSWCIALLPGIEYNTMQKSPIIVLMHNSIFISLRYVVVSCCEDCVWTSPTTKAAHSWAWFAIKTAQAYWGTPGWGTIWGSSACEANGNSSLKGTPHQHCFVATFELSSWPAHLEIKETAPIFGDNITLYVLFLVWAIHSCKVLGTFSCQFCPSVIL